MEHPNCGVNSPDFVNKQCCTVISNNKPIKMLLTCPHNQNRKNEAMSKYEPFPGNNSLSYNKSTSRVENITFRMRPTKASWFFSIKFLQ